MAAMRHRRTRDSRSHSITYRLGLALLFAGCVSAAGVTAQGQAPPQLLVSRNSNMLGGEQILRLNPFEVRGDVLGRADNEPSCTISTRNPEHVICGANTYRMVDVPGVSATSETRDAWQGVYQSANGGDTWESTLHPGFFLDPSLHPFKLLGFRAAADPTLRSGVAGVAFYSGISFKSDKSLGSLFVSTFADLNNRENDPLPFKFVRTVIVDVKATPKFIDKPWMYVEAAPPGQMCTMVVRADEDGGTPLWASTWWGKLVSSWLMKHSPGWRPRDVVVQRVPASIVHVMYSVFQDLDETKADVMYTRSTNCGLTFSTPRRLNTIQEPFNGAAIAKPLVAGSQRVFGAWRKFSLTPATSPHTLVGVVSNNNGTSWSAPVVIANICPYEQRTSPNRFRTTAFPTMTADANGRAYVGWADRGRQPDGSCDPTGAARIMVSTSTDGLTWSAPQVAVPSPTDEHQIMPSLAFTAGKLFLAWVDFTEDVSGVFGQFVDEANLFLNGVPVNPPARRHTTDMRVAVADPGMGNSFGDESAQVSRYLMGRTPSISPSVPGTPIQLQWNAWNRRWARRGTVPFAGDYIDIATLPYLPPDPTANPPRAFWTPNNGQVPVTPNVLIAWTDNRDMRDLAPSELNADGSVPFTVPVNKPGILELPPGNSIVDPSQTRQVCVPGSVFKTGTTNQNIYAARAVLGFAASSPSGNKTLGSISRTFVVYVRNDSDLTKTFRLQIPVQPPGGTASFDQFNPGQTVVEPIIVRPLSSIARTVFVNKDATTTPLDPRATVRVDVTEIVGGASAGTDTIYLNADQSAPEIDSPEIDSREIYTPEIDSPEIDSLGVLGPEIDSPEIDSPEIDSETLKALGLQAPEIDSPEIDSPEIDSSEIATPEIDSPEIDSAPITDVKFKVTNDGNTTAQYNSKTLVRGVTAGAWNYQIIVRRKYDVRSVSPGCEPATVPVSKVLVNGLNINPQAPEIDSPEIDSSAPGTASFFLAPGETGEVVVRARKVVSSAPDLTVNTIGIATQQEAVNTDEAAAGITEPLVFTSFLSVASNQLPAGITGTPYTRQLVASGGVPPYTWSLASGTTLPPGLTLSASGLISGTPTAAGTFPFTVQVQDVSAPPAVATRALSITITTAGVASLAVVSQPTNTVFGEAISPDVSVRAVTGAGTPAAGVTVTIAIGTNPGGGTVSGTLSAVTGSTGIATFDTLSINQLGVGYTLVASAAGFSTATSVPFTIASSVSSGVTVFNNKIAFLAATGATNATGPLPSLGAVNSGATVGSVTFNLAPGAQNLNIGGSVDWYPPLLGNEISFDFENLDVSFATPVTAMGFTFIEPNVTMPPWGATPVDSTFLVTLFNGTAEVGSFSFNAPDDQIAFVGVSSGTPFTRARIIDTTGNHDDEYYGEFYTSFGVGAAYVVTNTADSGAGSLRQAILNANATTSADSVIFNIPGAGLHTISLASALPALTAAGGAIYIDGSTQPGYNGVPLVEVDGGPAAVATGLNVLAPQSAIRGLMVNGFVQDGITLNSSGNIVIGNWLGVAPSGTAAKPNGVGVRVLSSQGNAIGGGQSVLARNVISGNNTNGVAIGGTGATLNAVEGNYIGTNALGNAALPNLGNGVHVVDSPSNGIGGLTSASGNLISGNGGEGVRIDGASSVGNIVRSNVIGTNATQTGSIGNSASGVYIRRAPSNSVIGNTISGNLGFGGVAICGNLGGFCGGFDVGTQTSNGDGNVVQSNFVAGNVQRGVSLDGVANTAVGTAGANNITGNGLNGVVIFGVGATGNQIAFNAINSNTGNGVLISGAGNVGNRVQSNSFINNTALAIDLGGDGVTPNDTLDADTGPNNLQNSPVIPAASSIAVDVTLHSTPTTTFVIQLYESITACSASGQGNTLVAAFNVVTNASGNAQFTQGGLALPIGNYTTATATDPSGNTSEFSPCTLVLPPVD